MARKSQENGTAWGDIQFAKWSWTKENDDGYESWLREKAPDFAEAVTWLVDAEYKVSISWDTQSEAYKCSATGTGRKNPNEGICITSWAESADDAVLITIYKIDVIFEGKRAPTSGSGKGRRG